jgi:hypothetical protein
VRLTVGRTQSSSALARHYGFLVIELSSTSPYFSKGTKVNQHPAQAKPTSPNFEVQQLVP